MFTAPEMSCLFVCLFLTAEHPSQLFSINLHLLFWPFLSLEATQPDTAGAFSAPFRPHWHIQVVSSALRFCDLFPLTLQHNDTLLWFYLLFKLGFCSTALWRALLCFSKYSTAKVIIRFSFSLKRFSSFCHSGSTHPPLEVQLVTFYLTLQHTSYFTNIPVHKRALENVNNTINLYIYEFMWV